MGQVNLLINGRSYTVGCADGEEEHIGFLGSFLDKRVSELIGTVGQVGELRLLLMAALTVADDLAGLQDDFQKLKSEVDLLRADLAEAEQGGTAIANLAARIEDIAARLQQS